MNKILAMILAGGRVDEFDVLTLYRPKSAVPFGGMFRIIDFPLSNLMHSKIERAGILLQYRSSSLIKHIGIGASWDMIGRNRGVFVLPPYKAASSSTWYKGTADAIYQNYDFIEEFNHPYLAAEKGYIDDVILPSETRRKLIAALWPLLRKRDKLPNKKHGNVPL